MLKRAEGADVKAIAEMAVLMWDGYSVEDLIDEFTQTVNNVKRPVFLKYIQDIPAAFAMCGLRHDYVEGTDSSPVGYLEGIFVKKEYRKLGYAKELLTACEKWAKEQGCTEFASDCELRNTGSFDFHMRMGFREANRLICFTKKI